MNGHINEWVDKLAISELITRYFQLVDEKDFSVEQFQALFTDDATLTRPNNTITTGPAEIADSNSKSFGRFRATQHFPSGILVTINGEAAKARVNVLAMHLWADGFGDPNALERYFEGGVVVDVSARRTALGWRLMGMDGRNIWRTGSSVGMMQINKD
jgi:hypothetical protein